MPATDDFPTAEQHGQVAGFPNDPGAGADAAVEFGWDDDRKLSGRRRKAEAKRKAKPGSFGRL
jgi:hypothetical protein